MSIGISAQESVNPLVNRVYDSKYDFLLNFCGKTGENSFQLSNINCRILNSKNKVPSFYFYVLNEKEPKQIPKIHMRGTIDTRF